MSMYFVQPDEPDDDDDGGKWEFNFQSDHPLQIR